MKTNMQKRTSRLKKALSVQNKATNLLGIDIHIDIKDVNHANQWQIILNRFGIYNYDKQHASIGVTCQMYSCNGVLPLGLVIHGNSENRAFMIVNFEAGDTMGDLHHIKGL